MRILVTNDDGIHAPGLDVAEAIARSLSDDVWVVAPENEQSGASHSLTLNLPLRLRKVAERRYAVTGTPTDCVLMGCLNILKKHPPTLILSGVNAGSNVADDVTYSGTIAGAMEGCALGIAAIALSQAIGETREDIDWSAAREHGPAVVRRLVEAGWPQGTLMNVNFPVGPVSGVVAVPQGKFDLQSSHIEEHKDARARAYYWIGLRRHKSMLAPDTDVGAIQAGKISVTPLHLNLTEHAVLKKTAALLGKL